MYFAKTHKPFICLCLSVNVAFVTSHGEIQCVLDIKTLFL